MAGYITGYVISSNIWGLELESETNLLTRTVDFMPPDRMIRRRTVEGMGQWAGFIQDVGIQVERARIASFIVQESVPVLEAYQGIRQIQAGPAAGADIIWTAGFVTEDFDGNIGHENYRMRGHILDIDKQTRPGDGGGAMTVMLYLNAWTEYATQLQINRSQAEQRVRHLDFDKYSAPNLLRDITWVSGEAVDIAGERNRALGFPVPFKPDLTGIPSKFALI